jgi:hypothetical protein
VRVLLLLAAVAALALGCEAPPVVPLPQPHRIVLDIERAVWTIGRTDTEFGFAPTLRDELRRYNVYVVDRGQPAELAALVDLGLWNNWHAIDVAIVRGPRTVHVGRVTVPDQSMPTLAVAAQMVAGIIARGVVTTAAPDPAPLQDLAVDAPAP